MSRASSSSGARWQTPSCITLHWKRLEEHYIVYNSGSGHTHVLDPVAVLVIQQLAERCLETTELVQQVAGLLGLETTEEFSNELRQALSELDKLGLVEPLIS
jgi:PqqD family protein of HPr-rel-A system